MTPDTMPQGEELLILNRKLKAIEHGIETLVGQETRLVKQLEGVRFRLRMLRAQKEGLRQYMDAQENLEGNVDTDPLPF